jgi:hypothetical protein
MWLAAAAVPFAVALVYGALALNMWLRSRLMLGPVPAETRGVMRQLLSVSRQAESLEWSRLVALYAGIGMLLAAVVSRNALYLLPAAAALILLWWIRIRTTTPPFVLLLGTSTPTSVRRHRDVKRALSPLRVVSLLDSDIPWERELAREVALDCYRTTLDDDWWAVVTQLIGIAPMVALDAAVTTDGVRREWAYIVQSGWTGKCLGLTPPDGAAPLFGDAAGVRCVRYEDAARGIAEFASAWRAAARTPGGPH